MVLSSVHLQTTTSEGTALTWTWAWYKLNVPKQCGQLDREGTEMETGQIILSSTLNMPEADLLRFTQI